MMICEIFEFATAAVVPLGMIGMVLGILPAPLEV